MLYVVLSASVSENIGRLTVKDLDSDPADYAFELVCTSCREKHDSKVTINRLEKHEMNGSRGEASFVMKCKFCGKDCSINLERTQEELYNLQEESNRELVEKTRVHRKKIGIKNVDASKAVLLALDCRGCEVLNLDYSNLIFDARLASGKVMEATFDEENEWYDYDDDAGEEVSVTDLKFDIVKAK
ncbi:LAQU0S09e04038g1_1 [Lachancea quebecensis]|uniref:LAQU0S09e04038g1_1 n=1 Tax=Lachancea quebecensis TaxID=1654605 RepID=A0A0P1KU16_9SACH|nr:LAQU0S09e04038g1_1 [Lachancea quebecensis]